MMKVKLLVLCLCSMLPLSQPKVFLLSAINGIEDNNLSISDPPPHTDYPKMARWLVHNSEWTAMGTISTVPAIVGFPMVGDFS